MKSKNLIIILFIVAFIILILGILYSINNITSKTENNKQSENSQIKDAINVIKSTDKNINNLSYVETDLEGNVVLKNKNNYEYIVDLKTKEYKVLYRQIGPAF